MAKINRKGGDDLTWRVRLFGERTLELKVAKQRFSEQKKQYVALIRLIEGDQTFDAEAFFFDEDAATFKPNGDGRKSEAASDELRIGEKRLKSLRREVKVFTFGIFIITIGERIRAGYIRRTQILAASHS